MRKALLSLVSGLLLALSFSTHSTGWLAWWSMIPLFYVLFSSPYSKRVFAYWGWLFGMGFYIGVIHWLKELHPLTWLHGVTHEMSLLIVFGGIWGISLVVALWTTLWGALIAFFRPQSTLQKILIPTLLWMAMEWAQQLGDISLPWARLAISQYHNLHLLQILHFTGSTVIGGVIVAFNVAAALFLIDFLKDSTPKPYLSYPTFRAALVCVCASLLLHAYGFWRVNQFQRPETPSQAAKWVSVIQGNIPQGQKWTKDNFWTIINGIWETYEGLTHEALNTLGEAEVKDRLVIWPESALPIPLRLVPDYNRRFQNLSKESKTYLLSGTFDRESFDSAAYNGAVLYAPDAPPPRYYYKRHLVPFGEYFPYRKVIGGIPVLGPLIESLNVLGTDTLAGTEAALMETPYGRLGTLVCFESVYPQVARDSVKSGAQFLAVVTNDGWYRDAIALYQHLGHSVLRAIENQRFVARSGNTGISAFIGPEGRILSQSLPMRETFLTHWMEPADVSDHLTLYTRLGDWPAYLSLLLLFVLAWRRPEQALSEEELPSSSTT